jgi:DNA-directed RNA polymerase subunit RPC12/RpoP
MNESTISAVYEENQRPATWFNRLRGWLSFNEWERVRCRDCGEDRLVRQDPALDCDAPVQWCDGCGSPSLWPIERQSAATWCPDCGRDLLHQQDAFIANDDGTANYRLRCRYCGTESCWHLAAPVPIQLTDDAVDTATEIHE